MGNTKSLTIDIVGVTPEKKEVISGKSIFKLMDTYGLPLEIVLDSIKHDYVVAYQELYDAAIAVKWNPKRIIEVMENAICDIYGADYKNEVFKRLRQ